MLLPEAHDLKRLTLVQGLGFLNLKISLLGSNIARIFPRMQLHFSVHIWT